MKSVLIAILAFVLADYTYAGGEVAWRTDYAKAVQEASAKKLPLFLDFGTESCVFCRKLDATTFRNPAVIRVLAERFVAVKIDADRDPKLARAMRIDSYPTLVVAGPDGTVLASNPGYLDAAGMLRFLQGSLAKLPRPAVEMASAMGTASAESASNLLSLAKKDLQDGFYLCCVERCDRLIRNHPRAEEREEARQVAERAMQSGGSEIRDLFASLGRPR